MGTTRGIKNCRYCRLFKGCSPLQLLYNLIGNRPQSATFHTANRYNEIAKSVVEHFIEKSVTATTITTLQGVHIAIINAKNHLFLAPTKNFFMRPKHSWSKTPVKTFVFGCKMAC